MSISKTHQELLNEIDELRAHLEEAESTIRAIRSGEVDALVINGSNGAQIFTLQHAERPYRVLVEAMQEGAVTASEQGLILYCNQRFANMLKMPLEKVLGAALPSLITPDHQTAFQSMFLQARSQSVHTEVDLRAGDGTFAPVLITLSPFTLDEETTAICLVVTDQTIQQRREHEIILLQKLQFAVSEATSLNAALHVVLQNIIETTSWAYGEAWTLALDRTKLECASDYYHSSVQPEPNTAQVHAFQLDLGAGLIGQAWLTKTTLVVSNPNGQFSGSTLTQPDGFTAGAVVPVVADDEVVSVLAFFTRQSTQLDEHFIRLVSTVASQLGSFMLRKRSENALRQAHQELEMRVRERTIELETTNTLLRRENIERRRAEEAERKQRNMAEALRDIAIALNGSLELTEVLQRILSNIDQVVAHSAADIMLLEGRTIYVVGCRGYDEYNLEKIVMSYRISLDDAPILRQIAETGQPVIMSEVMNYPGWAVLKEREWHHSYAGLPIRAANQLIGFLNIVSTTPDFFTPDRVDALQVFADAAAVAIQNARLHQQAQALAASRERERLARDLHDAVSQTLFSASIIAETLLNHWQRNPKKTLEQLEQLRMLTRGAQAEMRSLLLELRPKALEQADLKILLPQLVEATKTRKRIAISVQCDDVGTLPSEVKLSFYRIAQEALNNITKHSQATKASVLLKNQQGDLELLISDNGRGFDPETITATSLGLSIMRERAAAIGAALNVSSTLRQGTKIQVVWHVAEMSA